MLSLAHKSPQLLFISSHSFFHQLGSVCQVFLRPGNKGAWTPAGEEAHGLGRLQVCLRLGLPHLVVLKPAKEATASAPGSRLSGSEQRENESFHSVAAIS